MEAYKPPESDLVGDNNHNSSKDDKFYVVSPNKFLILFISTMGLYQLYWFYKNWDQYRNAEKINLWPIPRAIFAIFFTHSLFRAINAELDKEDQDKWQHALAATLFVIVTIISNMDRLLDKLVGPLMSLVIVLLSVFVTAWIIYPAQLRINQVCHSPNGQKNKQITAINVLWIIIGMVFWVLSVLGIIFTINPNFADGLI